MGRKLLDNVKGIDISSDAFQGSGNPDTDHTLGTSRGSYAHLDVRGKQNGEKAQLDSVVFQPAQDGKCAMR